jgi:hypothetical protein
MKLVRTVFCALLFVAVAQFLTGCATDDPDSVAQTPWNQPTGWEGPLPSTINQGR